MCVCSSITPQIHGGSDGVHDGSDGVHGRSDGVHGGSDGSDGVHGRNIGVHSGSDGVHGGSINLKACKQTFHLLHNIIGMYHAANQSYNTFLKELGYFNRGF